MPKKLTIGFVKDEVVKRGFIPLFEEYTNSSDANLKCKCQNGHIFYISYSKIKSGRGCKQCYFDRLRVDGQVVVDKFLEHDLTPLFSADEYVKNDQLLPYKCNKHPEKIQYVRYGDLRRERTHVPCKECEKEFMRMNLSDVRLRFVELNYTPTFEDSDYKDNESQLSYVCNKHPNLGTQHTTWISVYRNNNYNTKCSCTQCLEELYDTMHPNRVENKELRARNNTDCYRWKKQVKQKFDNKCGITGDIGTTEYPLNAHHIENFATNPELRYDVNNSFLMTESMHMLFHSIYGRINNTKEQLDEFISNQQALTLSSKGLLNEI